PPRPLRRWAFENRPAPEPLPGDELWDAGPGLVARRGVDLRENRPPVPLRQLALLQCLENVLVRHRGEAELRAAIPETVALQDLRVVVEGAAVRPGAVGRRHVGDRPPPRAPERGGEREAFALGQRGVTTGAVDPDSRLEGGG